MTITYYIGTEAELLAVDAQISTNAGWPSGGTNRWAEPRETTTAGVFAIPAPPLSGSHGFSYETLTSGVSQATSDNVSFPEPPEE